MTPSLTLTREEQLVMAAAGTAFSASHQATVMRTVEQGVVWRGVQYLAERNNVGALMHRALRNVPQGLVPEQVQARFRQSYLSTFQRNAEFARVIADLDGGFRASGVKAVFLRGLVLAEYVYGNPALRRFADIDVLVSRPDVPAALATIERLGGVPRRGSLSDGYYYRNHFHIERVLGNGAGSTVELHWGLDHRYTMFTIDVEGLLARSMPVRVGETVLYSLDPVDNVLALCLHAAKHCPAVRYFPTAPLLARRILLDGWLTQILDVAMAIEHSKDLDWDRLVATARAWGADQVAGGALEATHRLLVATVPPWVRRELPPTIRCRGVRLALVSTFLHPARSLEPLERRAPLTRFLLRRMRFQEDAVFHPVRLLDLLSYFSPSKGDLARWLGRKTLRPLWWWRTRHAVGEALRLVGNALDLAACRTVRILKPSKTPPPPRSPMRAPAGEPSPREVPLVGEGPNAMG